MTKFGPISVNNWNSTCKSPNHQDFMAKITKSPHFFEVNHHHHTFLKSPNHQFFGVQITKSPAIFGLNHQSPKTLVPPHFIIWVWRNSFFWQTKFELKVVCQKNEFLQTYIMKCYFEPTCHSGNTIWSQEKLLLKIWMSKRNRNLSSWQKKWEKSLG